MPDFMLNKPLQFISRFLTFNMLLLGMLCCGCAENKATDAPQAEKQSEPAPAETAPPKTGDVTLSLSDVEGFNEILAKQNGKVVLVDFWATWCVPCVKNFHHTVEWKDKYADQGLAVITVSMDESDAETEKAVREFLNSKDARSVNILATAADDQDPMETFGIDGGALPHYRVYDRNGKLIKKFSFADPDKQFTQEDIEATIQEALKPNPE